VRAEGPAPASALPMTDRSPAPDFELLFRHAPGLFLVLEPRAPHRILAASEAYLRATRQAREALAGRPVLEAFPGRPGEADADVPAQLRASLERAAATGRVDSMEILRYDLPRPGPSGAGYEKRFWSPVNAPVTGEDGELHYIIHRVEDVTDYVEMAEAALEGERSDEERRLRLAAEREVLRAGRAREEAMRRLRTANEELEAFAYSASHDLRAPLLTIEGYCRLLAEERGDRLDTEARHWLGRIESGVHRMADTIEDLLALSRVGQLAMHRRRVDVSDLARRAAEELHRREPGRRVEVRIAEGLQALADERLLGIALANLVGNAWKYTARREDARIEVSRVEGDPGPAFCVADNGAGFAMDEASGLFKPFVRLHPPKEFDGHGIGLATVKRIVERHDGRVWAEAERERGARFYFTLGE
jgi:signal transduction histidine kinase